MAVRRCYRAFSLTWPASMNIYWSSTPIGLVLSPNMTAVSLGAIHSTKIPTGPTGKSGPPQKVDPFFLNFSGWTEPIH